MGILDSIIGAESGGNPYARNSRSSATGLGQFIDTTWIDTITKHRPDLIVGKNPQEILELRTDPELSREMTAAYAKDNSAMLSGAGLPVTPGSTYLAHFAGPQGAMNIMRADPAMSAIDILGSKVAAANPFLRGMSAGDLISWANKKMGASGAPQQPLAMLPRAMPSVAPQTSDGAPYQQPMAAPYFPGQPTSAASMAQGQSSADIYSSMPAQSMQTDAMALPPIEALRRKLKMAQHASAPRGKGFY